MDLREKQERQDRKVQPVSMDQQVLLARLEQQEKTELQVSQARLVLQVFQEGQDQSVKQDLLVPLVPKVPMDMRGKQVLLAQLVRKALKV